MKLNHFCIYHIYTYTIRIHNIQIEEGEQVVQLSIIYTTCPSTSLTQFHPCTSYYMVSVYSKYVRHINYVIFSICSIRIEKTKNERERLFISISNVCLPPKRKLKTRECSVKIRMKHFPGRMHDKTSSKRILC